MPRLWSETVWGVGMNAPFTGSVSRRRFLLTLVAVCYLGGKSRIPIKMLDEGQIARMATWAG